MQNNKDGLELNLVLSASLVLGWGSSFNADN